MKKKKAKELPATGNPGLEKVFFETFLGEKLSSIVVLGLCENKTTLIRAIDCGRTEAAALSFALQGWLIPQFRFASRPAEQSGAPHDPKPGGGS